MIIMNLFLLILIFLFNFVCSLTNTDSFIKDRYLVYAKVKQDKLSNQLNSLQYTNIKVYSNFGDSISIIGLTYNKLLSTITNDNTPNTLTNDNIKKNIASYLYSTIDGIEIETIEPVVKFRISDKEYSIKYIYDESELGYDRIDQKYQPCNHLMGYYYTGNNTNVYIMDTGIRISHSLFKYNNMINDFTYYAEYYDDQGHGTHVAGITSIVAPTATIYNIKVMDYDGTGTSEAVVAGLNHIATRPKGIINMSFSGQPTTSMDNAIRSMHSSGYFFAAAAGNDGSDACNYSPGRVDQILTVGASIALNDHRYPVSNFGSCVDIFAPGYNIKSASNLGDGVYISQSGTSMAAPLVAGVMAHYLEVNPSLTPSELYSLVISDATPDVLYDVMFSPNLLLYNPYNPHLNSTFAWNTDDDSIVPILISIGIAAIVIIVIMMYIKQQNIKKRTLPNNSIELNSNLGSQFPRYQPPVPPNMQPPSQCPVCFLYFDINQINEHIDICLNKKNSTPNENPSVPPNIQPHSQCPVCFLYFEVNQINEHIDICLNKKNSTPNENPSVIQIDQSAVNIPIEKVTCPSCNKEFIKDDINSHLDTCLK